MKRRLGILFTILCLTMATISCATVGKKFDTTHVNDIQKGKDTKQTITQWFGEPHMVTSLSNSPAGCVERWQWTYAHSVAGGRTVSDALIVDFSNKGIVCDNAFARVNQ